MSPLGTLVVDLDEELAALLGQRWEAGLVGGYAPRQVIPPPPCSVRLGWGIAKKGRVVGVSIWRDGQHFRDLPFDEGPARIYRNDRVVVTLTLRNRS